MPDTPDTEKQKRPPSRKKEPGQFRSIFIISILILAVMGAVFFFFGRSEHEPGRVTPVERQVPAPAITKPPQTRPSPEPAGPAAEAQVPAATRQGEKPGAPGAATAVAVEDQAKQCRQLAGNLHHFFSYLDQQEYLRPFDLKVPSQAYFVALAAKLLNNPPIVSGESNDLYTMLKNMAHFFRVIGRDNILLIKTILDRERDKIEDVAAELYQWTAIGACGNEQFKLNAPLPQLYEYAGFFLNTMGGRSYLFRRDSRSRLLVDYYAILIIDRANSKQLNKYGIDIRPIIPRLIQDIKSSNQLIYKEKYLDHLYDLQVKYQ